MTPEQKKHLTTIQLYFDEKCGSKYVKGVKEHGGNLWDHSPDWLLDQAIDEAIDQIVYLVTIKLKLWHSEEK